MLCPEVSPGRSNGMEGGDTLRVVVRTIYWVKNVVADNRFSFIERAICKSNKSSRKDEAIRGILP
jgi:hypothetical protein